MDAFQGLIRKYKAVIFDFDGVLARTADDNLRAWEYALSAYRVELDKEHYLLLEGRKGSEIANILIEKYDLPKSAHDSIIKLKNLHYTRYNQISFYEGTGDLLDDLKEFGIKIAIASGGNSERLHRTLGEEALALFDAVVTGDCCASKPSPEPFLEAARRLKVLPKDCLVIENAPLGIEAAKRAGMDCIALSTTLAKHHLSTADKVLHNIPELGRMLVSNVFATY